MVSYSHSRLSTFNQCKYKYKLQYIDKVKVDIPTSIEAFMGDMVHRVLAKLYQDLKFQKVNTLQELIMFYSETWKNNWDDKILIVKKQYTAEDYRETGIRFIANYYDAYKPFNQMTVLGLETQDRLELPDGNNYHIRIDKLGKIDDTYYVCDYKTNSRMKAQEEADTDKQLAMYSIWVKNKYPDAKKVVLEWDMLAFNERVLSERTDEQLLQLIREILEDIRQAETCTEFPTNKNALCGWCVFQQMCPLFKHKFQTQEEKEGDTLGEQATQEEKHLS